MLCALDILVSDVLSLAGREDIDASDMDLIAVAVVLMSLSSPEEETELCRFVVCSILGLVLVLSLSLSVTGFELLVLILSLSLSVKGLESLVLAVKTGVVSFSVSVMVDTTLNEVVLSLSKNGAGSVEDLSSLVSVAVEDGFAVVASLFQKLLESTASWLAYA